MSHGRLNWTWALGLLVFLGTLLSLPAAGPVTYRLQGYLEQRFFNPAKVGEVTPADFRDFQETTYFDLEVSNCLFQAMLIKQWQDPAIAYFAVGTDGTNSYRQTVFKETGLERVLVPRSDNSGKEVVRPRSKASANSALGEVHLGVLPKDRGFNEGILCFALASHCQLPTSPNQATEVSLPSLWEHGDDYIESYLYRTKAWVRSLPQPPFLPATVAFLDQKTTRQQEFSHYTNTLYSVAATWKLGDLELPKEFTLYHGVEAGHTAAGGRGQFHLITLYRGVVTNAVREISKAQFLPQLSERTLVSDHRYYEWKKTNLVPVARLVTAWSDIPALKTNIPLAMAFPRVAQAQAQAAFSAGPAPVARSGVPWKLASGVLLAFLMAAAWLRRRVIRTKQQT